MKNRLFMQANDLPIITHIPHSSLDIPQEDQVNILLSVPALHIEINKLNDHLTDRLFNSDLTNVTPLVFPVNRFLIDVERFEQDAFEPMSAKGMGALYTHDTEGNRFRADLSDDERELLLDKYYRPHHKMLSDMTTNALKQAEQVLIIDSHSFPDDPLPCDESQESNRPDICIGTDAFHTPIWLIELTMRHFEEYGYRTEINKPYSGTMVPLSAYHKDERVWSIMIEINRRLYLDDNYQATQPGFDQLHKCINELYSKITKQAPLPATVEKHQ